MQFIQCIDKVLDYCYHRMTAGDFFLSFDFRMKTMKTEKLIFDLEKNNWSNNLIPTGILILQPEQYFRPFIIKRGLFFAIF